MKKIQRYLNRVLITNQTKLLQIKNINTKCSEA